MDVFTELLPASFTAKAEATAKDSKQKKGRNDKNKPSLPQLVKDKPEQVKMVETERRTGEERREKVVNRGRWLESRDKKDRRASKSKISVKI
jgi:hypothetical protein